MRAGARASGAHATQAPARARARVRRAALLVACAASASAAACTPEIDLSLSPLSPEDCRTYCVDQVELTVGDARSSHACGAPIVLPPLGDGQTTTLSLRTRGAGSALVGQVTLAAEAGEARSVSLVLEPEVRPVISAVRAPRAARVGATTLTLEGQGFGAVTGVVWVGEASAEVEVWTDTRIVARATASGDVVVERCGVRSSPVASGLRDATLDDLRPLAGVAGCEAARLVAGALPMAGNDGTPAPVLFDCGVDPCGATVWARLGLTGDTVLTRTSTFGACAQAFDVVEEKRALVGAAGGLSRCRWDDAMGVECRALDTTHDVLDVAALANDDVYFTVRGATNLTRQLWRLEGDTPRRLLADQVQDAVAVQGRYALVRSAGRVELWVMDGAAPSLRVPLPECDVPRQLFVEDARSAAARAVVACGRSGTAELFRLDLAESTTGPVGVVARLPELAPAALAVTVDGRVAVLRAGPGPAGNAGTLAVADLERGVELGRWPESETYAGAAVVRAPHADVFFVGGPQPGQVRRLDLR